VETHQPQLPLLLPHPRSAAQETQLLPALLLRLLLALHHHPLQVLLLWLLVTLEVAGSHHPWLLLLLGPLLLRRVSHDMLCGCRSHPDKPHSGLPTESAQSRAATATQLIATDVIIVD
jgi:hypothetical protein